MEFGHLSSVNLVDFSLPPSHPATAHILSATSRPAYLQPQVFIGCPTWINKAWKGVYYPASAQEKDYLHWYSRQFNTIELNTTFYQIPPENVIQRWQQQVSADFIFCPKLPQMIMQQMHSPQAQAETAEFYNALLGLKINLGPSFLQLPATMSPAEVKVITAYLENIPKDWALALEMRHENWFADPENANYLFDVLEALGISTVITDVAGRRDVLHQRLTSNTAFIRFNGYGLHFSDYTRIDAWVQRLAEWFDMGLNKVFFFIHQENQLHAPVLINYLITQLNKTCSLHLKTCEKTEEYIQGTLF